MWVASRHCDDCESTITKELGISVLEAHRTEFCVSWISLQADFPRVSREEHSHQQWGAGKVIYLHCLHFPTVVLGLNISITLLFPIYSSFGKLLQIQYTIFKNLWGTVVCFLSSLQGHSIKQKCIWTFSVHVWKGTGYTEKAKRIFHKYNKIQKTESTDDVIWGTNINNTVPFQ